MLGLDPTFTAQLATERSARLATDATHATWRRLLRQPHPAPPCAGLAAQLPQVVDLRSTEAEAMAKEPAAQR